MRNLSHFTLAAMVLGMPMLSMAAAGTDLQQEYIQVRKIALKDPKVQDAFEKANERLDEKILEIDPSLKPIVDRQKAAPATAAVASPKAKVATRATALSTPEGRQHIVVKGETLSSIAAHYKVKVATLEKVNHITDDRKLQVGQKLTIPGGEPLETQPAAPAQTAQPATGSQQAPPPDNESFWDKLKNNF